VSGLPYWILGLGLAVVIVAILYRMEKWRPWREDMGRDVDGDFRSSEHGASLKSAAVPGPTEQAE